MPVSLIPSHTPVPASRLLPRGAVDTVAASTPSPRAWSSLGARPRMARCPRAIGVNSAFLPLGPEQNWTCSLRGSLMSLQSGARFAFRCDGVIVSPHLPPSSRLRLQPHNQVDHPISTSARPQAPAQARARMLLAYFQSSPWTDGGLQVQEGQHDQPGE